MARNKIYHTHPNPSGDPLFIVVDGLTCEECERKKKEARTVTKIIHIAIPSGKPGNKPRRKRN
jgi:hypothetical protein